jgi:hypothetical protein
MGKERSTETTLVGTELEGKLRWKINTEKMDQAIQPTFKTQCNNGNLRHIVHNSSNKT